MAKKSNSKTEQHTHKECGFCECVENEFLNYKGEPILGRCIWVKDRFLLNEKDDCKKLWIPPSRV
jgi:hypothetical protein